MDISGYADILFFAALAFYIFYKLNSVLGSDDGSEGMSAGSNHFTANDAKKREQKPVIAAVVQEEKQEAVDEPVVQDIPEPDIDDPKIAKTFDAIKAKDAGFKAGIFLAGAKAAFEMIVEAYAKGDKKTLKGLLHRDVYKEFMSAIEQREARGETLETTLISVESSDIIAASFKNNVAEITIKFVSEQVNLLKDKEDEIIDGEASTIDVVHDSWTFRRDISSHDPNWLLVATDGD